MSLYKSRHSSMRESDASDGRPLLPTGGNSAFLMISSNNFGATSTDDNLLQPEASFSVRNRYDVINSIGATELFWPLGIESKPLRVLASVFGSLFVGSFWCYFALRERAQGRCFGVNAQDWMVVFWIGLCHQLSFPFVIFNLDDPAKRYAENPTDFVSSVALYPVTCLYLVAISLTFSYKKDKAEKKGRRNVFLSGQEAVDRWLEEFRESVEVHSLALIPFSTLLAFVMMFAVRTCYPGPNHTHVGNCFGGRSDWDLFYESPPPPPPTMGSYSGSSSAPEGLSPPTDNDANAYYMFVSIFWWLQCSSIVACSCYGGLMYYQQMRQIEEFTYIKKYSATARSRKTKALFEEVEQLTHDLTQWNTVWSQLLTQLNERPFVRSVFSTTVVTGAITWFTCLFYIAINNVLLDQGVAAGTIATGGLATYAFFMLIFFVSVTVKVARIIEHQIGSISAAQNEIQRDLELKKYDMEIEEFYRKASSVQVLSHLDAYLQTNARDPQLVAGITLEGMRWITILASLLSLNIFFFALFGKHCHFYELDSGQGVGVN